MERKLKMFKWLIYFTLCVYALLDSYHTSIWIDLGGAELNPLVNYFMSITTPMIGLYLSKIPFLALLGYVVYKKL